MMRGPSAEQRRELGDFIRAQREKLAPATVGLAATGRRRTPGLRREEVSQLCGLSVTWYTWLEQGRDVSVSPVALARLAKALRFGRAERSYLFGLAGKRDPEPGGGEPEAIPPAVLAAVRTIGSPAYLLDRAWTARAWNRAAERLFVGWLDRPGEKNLLRFIFLDPAARRLICDFGERARRVVAEFRSSLSAHFDDPAVRALLDDLRRESGAFARLWDAHGVVGREGGQRTFNHPTDGFVHYEQMSFNLASQPDLKLTILVEGDAPPAPPGTVPSAG